MIDFGRDGMHELDLKISIVNITGSVIGKYNINGDTNQKISVDVGSNIVPGLYYINISSNNVSGIAGSFIKI